MRNAFLAAALLFAACNPIEPDAELDAESLAQELEPAELKALARALTQGRFGADPTAMNVNSDLHVYSTSRGGLNIPHFFGDNPENIGTLKAPTEALPDSERGVHLKGGIWAPSVRKAGDHYALWYSGEVEGSGKKCLWRAKSEKAQGPFQRVGDGQPICPHPEWNIDPYLFRAPDGFWLYSKVGGNLQRRQLKDDGLTFEAGSSWHQVLAPTQAWEEGDGQDRPLVENPAMVRLARPDGKQRWIFFYSSNAWRTKQYAIGYADCGDGPKPGPCTKESVNKAWLSSKVAGAPFGPGAASFFGYKGRDYMIIHGWQNRCDDPQDTCRNGSDPCPAGTKDNDCRFENPDGRGLYLFRVGLGAGGNPVAKAL